MGIGGGSMKRRPPFPISCWPRASSAHPPPARAPSIRCADPQWSLPNAVVGGILGALIGIAVGILFTDVVFANN
jgi:hypothetical protein